MGLATSWVPSALQKKRCVCMCVWRGERHPLLLRSPVRCWGKGGQHVPFPSGSTHSKENRGEGASLSPGSPAHCEGKRGEYLGFASPPLGSLMERERKGTGRASPSAVSPAHR